MEMIPRGFVVTAGTSAVWGRSGAIRVLGMGALSLVLLLGSAGPASGQQEEDPLVGCYQLTVGTWHPAPAPPWGIPPSKFRLLGTIGEAPSAARPEIGRTLVRPRIHQGSMAAAYWSRWGEDSIGVSWTTGQAGVALRMRIGADSLRGFARVGSDEVGGLVPTAPAIARGMPCQGIGSGFVMQGPRCPCPAKHPLESAVRIEPRYPLLGMLIGGAAGGVVAAMMMSTADGYGAIRYPIIWVPTGALTGLALGFYIGAKADE